MQSKHLCTLIDFVVNGKTFNYPSAFDFVISIFLKKCLSDFTPETVIFAD